MCIRDSFETVILLGILLGPLSALLGGAVLSVPAMLHHEYLTLPFFLAVAAVSGLYARALEPEEVWSFSPFVDLSIYRWVRRNLRAPRYDRQILLLILIVGMQMVRMWLARMYPGRLFTLNSPNFTVKLAIWVCPAVVVAIPLKIWNASRIEIKLKEQKRLVLEARFDALQRQINPHFLFNTLNSIASLVRFRPEMAREMIVQLGNILRALLRDHDSYVPFREELTFTDDYLGIEVVRFGAEKLRVVKEIDDATLELLVPCMVLQPLIENSIKHGPVSYTHLLVTGFSETKVRSTTETLGVGTRTAKPSSLPLSSGTTRCRALAAPVEVGIMERAAARPRRRSLCGKSRMT